jgi:hypothetical protein
LAALSAGATSALLVVLAERHLHAGPTGCGLLLGAIGVGAGLGPLALARLTTDPRRPALDQDEGGGLHGGGDDLFDRPPAAKHEHLVADTAGLTAPHSDVLQRERRRGCAHPVADLHCPELALQPWLRCLGAGVETGLLSAATRGGKVTTGAKADGRAAASWHAALRSPAPKRPCPRAD